jgi:hypothetical protein
VLAQERRVILPQTKSVLQVRAAGKRLLCEAVWQGNRPWRVASGPANDYLLVRETPDYRIIAAGVDLTVAHYKVIGDVAQLLQRVRLGERYRFLTEITARHHQREFRIQS